MARPLAYDPAEGSRQLWHERGWDDAAEGVAVVVSLMRVEQLFMTQANQLLHPLGLTFARYQVLGVIRWRSVLLGEVGDALWITPGTVTSSVDRLEGADLLRRVQHPGDARATLAQITPKGRRVFDRAVKALNKELFGAIALEGDEREMLVALLGKLRAGAGDVVGVPGPLAHG